MDVLVGKIYVVNLMKMEPLESSFVYFRERSLFMAGVGTEEEVLYALKKFYPTICLCQIVLYPTEGKQLNKGAFMLTYGICFYTTLAVKNYSCTPPNTAYFFSYPTILSSVPTPVINNDRSLSNLIITGTTHEIKHLGPCSFHIPIANNCFVLP